MSRRSLAPHCLSRSPTLAITIYYLGRKSKLSFHNEIPPSSLARDAPLISFSPKHVLRPLRGWWRWRRGKRGRRMEVVAKWTGTARKEALPLLLPSLSLRPQSRAARGREGASSVRSIPRSLPQYPRQSLHSFSRSVCMIRATCRPSRSLAGGCPRNLNVPCEVGIAQLQEQHVDDDEERAGGGIQSPP